MALGEEWVGLSQRADLGSWGADQLGCPCLGLPKQGELGRGRAGDFANIRAGITARLLFRCRPLD